MEVVKTIRSMLLTIVSVLLTIVVPIMKDLAVCILTLVGRSVKQVSGLTQKQVTYLTMGYVHFNVIANACYIMRDFIDQNKWLRMVLDNYQSFGIIVFLYIGYRLYHKMMGTAMFRGCGFVSAYCVEKCISCCPLFAMVCYIIVAAIDHSGLNSFVVGNTPVLYICNFLCIVHIGYLLCHKKPKTD